MGTLFLIATPIGNLGDVTRRSVEVLGQVDQIVAEDTRRSRQLLSHLGIAGKPLWRLDANASSANLERVIDALQAGKNVALLTDAGTPGVSDPGAALVQRCHEKELTVTALPGPSALTTAIAASGLVDGPFLFVGFLPRKGEKRRRWLARVNDTQEAVILFEAPSRMQTTLTELAAANPDRSLCVARELTKKFEQVEVRTLAEWAAEPREWQGELTLVLAPTEPLPHVPDEAEITRRIAEELRQGRSAREIADQLHAEFSLPKRLLYQRTIAFKNF